METCCTCHFVTLESYSAIYCREDEVYLDDWFGEVGVRLCCDYCDYGSWKCMC